jgi:hypothetical protein
MRDKRHRTRKIVRESIEMYEKAVKESEVCLGFRVVMGKPAKDLV